MMPTDPSSILANNLGDKTKKRVEINSNLANRCDLSKIYDHRVIDYGRNITQLTLRDLRDIFWNELAISGINYQ
jgi:hypothetical protein